MGKWDDDREWLEAARDVAEVSQERLTQEYDIVVTQQESLWDSLTEEFRSAVTSINIGSGGHPLLTLNDLPSVRGLAIIAPRPKNMGVVTVVFEPKLHQVTVKFTGRDDNPSLKYIIRANEQNRAEFSQQNVYVTNEAIVSKTLSQLR